MGVLPARRRVPDPHQPGGGAAHGEPPRHVASAVLPETSFLVGMDRVRQSDRQVQARGEGPNIAGLRLGRVLGGRANSDHYSIELGARAAFHLSPALATRTAGGLQYFNATGDTLLRLRPGPPAGRTSPPA